MEVKFTVISSQDGDRQNKVNKYIMIKERIDRLTVVVLRPRGFSYIVETAWMPILDAICPPNLGKRNFVSF